MQITVSKEFRAAFAKCMEFYEVDDAETGYEKQRVRENYADAERCYVDIAGKLNKQIE